MKEHKRELSLQEALHKSATAVEVTWMPEALHKAAAAVQVTQMPLAPMPLNPTEAEKEKQLSLMKALKALKGAQDLLSNRREKIEAQIRPPCVKAFTQRPQHLRKQQAEEMSKQAAEAKRCAEKMCHKQQAEEMSKQAAEAERCAKKMHCLSQELCSLNPNKKLRRLSQELCSLTNPKNISLLTADEGSSSSSAAEMEVAAADDKVEADEGTAAEMEVGAADEEVAAVDDEGTAEEEWPDEEDWSEWLPGAEAEEEWPDEEDDEEEWPDADDDSSSDGLEPAKDGIQLLKSEGKLPNLRYQWQDRPHTTRSIIRMTFKMCPESEKLLEMLITGPRSFAKCACHSHRFQQIWLQKQQEDPAAFFSVLTDLSYAVNFDNRSAPMTTFLLKLGPALGVLGDLAEDQDLSHSSDAAWAREVALQLVGPEGFAQLVIFAIDCDFAVATNLLTRLQDKSSPDIAVAQEEVHDCVEICRALFDEGLIFEEAPNGTYTNALLQSLQKTSHEIRLGRGQVGVLGWPNHSESALKRPVEHSRNLFQLAKSFFDLNYPGYTWRAKFATFTPSCW